MRFRFRVFFQNENCQKKMQDNVGTSKLDNTAERRTYTTLNVQQ